MRPALVAAAIALAGTALLGTPAPAQQPPGDAQTVQVPPGIMLEDLYAAYARPAAEEMTIRVRPPGGTERVETITVRTDPGDSRTPRRLGLEMGPLRVHAAEGKLTAISTSAPGKYFEQSYSGDLTSAVLGELLPPIPLPQLELAAQEKLTLAAPTPYTTGMVWTGAVAQTGARQPTMTLTGEGPSGPVMVIAHVATGRLIRISASIRGRAGDTSLELSFREIQAGDPASWAINVEGHTRVDSLMQLRSDSSRPGQVRVGQAVPEMSFTRRDLSPWTLSAATGASGEAPANALVLVMFRAGQGGLPAMGDAGAGLGVLRAIRRGDNADPVAFSAGAAIVIELADFQKRVWDQAAAAWAAGAPEPDPLWTAAELMWSSSVSLSIDRFAPGAGAAAVVIGPDRTLRGVVVLDGRAADGAGLESDLRAILKGPEPAAQEPPAPLPESQDQPTQEPRP